MQTWQTLRSDLERGNRSKWVNFSSFYSYNLVCYWYPQFLESILSHNPQVLSKKENKDEQVILRDLYQDKEFLRCCLVLNNLKTKEDETKHLWNIILELRNRFTYPDQFSLDWMKTEIFSAYWRRASSSLQKGPILIVPLLYFLSFLLLSELSFLRFSEQSSLFLVIFFTWPSYFVDLCFPGSFSSSWYHHICFLQT